MPSGGEEEEKNWPSCPDWCTLPHRDDEAHYGPCADVAAVNLGDDPVLVGLERGREGRAGDQIILLPQVSPWPYRPVDTLVFDLDGAAALRDVLNELLGAAGHPLARPVEGPFRTAI